MKQKHNISVRTLTTGAMLAALSIIIGIFCKNFLNFGNGLFRITFENFPIVLSGILFGPLAGGIVGAASDILSYILSTQSFAISPIVTLGASSVGIVAGLFSRYVFQHNNTNRIVFSTLLAHLVGSVIIKSIGLYAYYGSATLVRIPLYFVIATLEATLICFLSRHKAFCKLLQPKDHNQ